MKTPEGPTTTDNVIAEQRNALAPMTSLRVVSAVTYVTTCSDVMITMRTTTPHDTTSSAVGGRLLSAVCVHTCTVSVYSIDGRLPSQVRSTNSTVDCSCVDRKRRSDCTEFKVIFWSIPILLD